MLLRATIPHTLRHSQSLTSWICRTRYVTCSPLLRRAEREGGRDKATTQIRTGSNTVLRYNTA
ncbi:MAG: hypothetical protein ACK55Z_08655, partial [bacterium]